MADEKKYGAKLVNGILYTLGTKAFHKGVELEVTEDEKAHLEVNAVDKFRLEGQADVHVRPKFAFRELKAGEAVSDEGTGEAAAASVRLPRSRGR